MKYSGISSEICRDIVWKFRVLGLFCGESGGRFVAAYLGSKTHNSSPKKHNSLALNGEALKRERNSASI